MNISILERHHNRKYFDCEEPSLTDYLKSQVSQDINNKLAVCFVVTNDKQEVTGYYTLSTESLGREQIPEKYINQVPKNYHAPVILLGRLARDLRYKGSGLGEFLLMDALFRAYKLSEESIGAMAVVVDPISEQAHQFYQKYGFQVLPDSKKMFLPMRVIGALI